MFIHCSPGCQGTQNAVPGNSGISTVPSAPLSSPDLDQCFSDTQHRMPEASPKTDGGNGGPSCPPAWKCGAKMVLLRGTVWSNVWLIEIHGAYQDESGLGNKRLKILYFQCSGRIFRKPLLWNLRFSQQVPLCSKTFLFDNLPVS